MEHLNAIPLSDEVDELFAQEAKEKRVLARLLDRYSNQQNKYLATRGEMGTHHTGTKTFRTPSYVVSHDLMWIATKVKMGSEMPFMETHLDKATGRLIISEANIDELKQRKPDWSRQAALTAYLAHDKSRKFGSILAVVSPPWVDDPKHENWDKDGRALKSAVQFEPLDSAGRVGLLNLDDAFLYALDGQHRVMGLRGVKDLIENQFWIRSKENDPKHRVDREEFLKNFDLEISDLQSLMSERMHVEYVPAVLPGESREEGSRRIRSVFVAINSHAKATTKGENALLDEVDGYSIVARKVGVVHPLLQGAKGSRVNWKGSALPDRSQWYTTLEALHEMARYYIKGAKPELAKYWAPRFHNSIQIRPSEEEIQTGTDLFSDFLTSVHGLPVFQALEASDDVTRDLGELRAFPDVQKGTTGRGHLLLRPIGQGVLANAVGKLIASDDPQRMDIDEVFSILDKLDENGRFEAHRPQNVWYGVTFNFQKNKMEVAARNQQLAADLLVYLVRGGSEEERTRLLQSVIELRSVEGVWRPFDDGEMLAVKLGPDGKPDVTGLALPLPRQ